MPNAVTARISVLPVPAEQPPGSGTLGLWQLVLVPEGPLLLRWHRTAVRLEPGVLVLWDAAQPFAAAARTAAGAPSRVTTLDLPAGSLPFSDEALRALVAQPIRADGGAAALLARLLDEYGTQDAASPQAGWLEQAAVDLALALLAGLIRAAPPEPRQAALLRQIKEYIDGHLMDARLAPSSIARAHHISLRYLHHLFRHDDATVGGYLRARRLERCRADLADPLLAGQSVGTIRGRWGFGDATVFSRAFKRQYGLAPSEYRRRRHATPPAP
ncbi:helix-turn-helix domain-containing protein [Streptomyces sp. NPDC049555]|uniref:helix-turn-helix domain-containing protein n=1 Tax=Streptomyces sp. NPDC049555 TaxID=3154930 RepID=UPI003412212F